MFLIRTTEQNVQIALQHSLSHLQTHATVTAIDTVKLVLHLVIDFLSHGNYRFRFYDRMLEIFFVFLEDSKGFLTRVVSKSLFDFICKNL